MSGQIKKTTRVKRYFYRLMPQKDSGEFKFSSTVIPLSLRKAKSKKREERKENRKEKRKKLKTEIKSRNF